MALFDTLVDNFDDNSFNTSLWSRTSSALVVEQNNRLEIATVTTAARFNSVSTYDLTASQIVFEVETWSATIVDNQLGISDTQSNAPSNYLAFKRSASDLQVVKRVSNTITTLHTVTYSSTNHRWLRIRESGGIIYWDVSPDNSSWTNLYSESNPISVSALYVHVYMSGSVFLGGVTIYINQINPPPVVNTELVVDDLSIASSFSSPSLVQNFTLDVDDIGASISLDNALVEQRHTLAVQPVNFGVAIDSVPLVQHLTLDAEDADLAFSVDNIALVQHSSLDASDFLLSLLVTSPAIFTEGILGALSLSLGFSIGGVELQQKHTLGLDDVSIGFSADVSRFDVPVIAGDVSFALLSDNIALEGPVAVTSVGFFTSIDNIDLFQKHTIAVNDAFIDVTPENIGLTTGVMPADVSFGVSVDAIELVQKFNLLVQNVNFLLGVDEAEIVKFRPPIDFETGLEIRPDAAHLDRKQDKPRLFIASDTPRGVVERGYAFTPDEALMDDSEVAMDSIDFTMNGTYLVRQMLSTNRPVLASGNDFIGLDFRMASPLMAVGKDQTLVDRSAPSLRLDVDTGHRRIVEDALMDDLIVEMDALDFSMEGSYITIGQKLKTKPQMAGVIVAGAGLDSYNGDITP